MDKNQIKTEYDAKLYIEFVDHQICKKNTEINNLQKEIKELEDISSSVRDTISHFLEKEREILKIKEGFDKLNNIKFNI